MRLAPCALLLAIASLPGVAAAGGGSQLLLGDIDYGYRPPTITGPHRLVMLAGMGNDHMQVDTHNPEAQRWFDYALTLARAFEHADAKLAFRKAAALDPTCSMCIWGEAYALGPTINYLVDEKDSAAALALATQARRAAGTHLADEDRRLQAAMIARYDHVDASGSGDLRYAHDLDAMLPADPGNLELEIFDAEAWLIMEFHHDNSGLAPVIARLTPLVRANRDYTGLVHFYIHATEDGGQPQLAGPYAARLAQLCPNASHLVHMPAHTYYRLGRYEDAALTNVAALQADLTYAQATHSPTPLGRLMYHFHDVQFGLAAAMLSGDSHIALRLVDQFNRDFPDPSGYENHAEMGAGIGGARSRAALLADNGPLAAIMVLSSRLPLRQNQSISFIAAFPHKELMFRSLTVAALLIGSCAALGQEAPPTVLPAPAMDAAHASRSAEKAVLAGGCYWGTQGIFEHIKGITRVVAGFTGGHSDDDGGAESVMITFDPQVISYGRLLQIFFSVVHDPTQRDRQGPDVGSGYRSDIFYMNAEQHRVAQAYIAQLDRARVFRRPLVTRLDPFPTFNPVGSSQQDFMLKNPHLDYIEVNDVPKLSSLQRLFPASYRALPLPYR